MARRWPEAVGSRPDAISWSQPRTRSSGCPRSRSAALGLAKEAAATSPGMEYDAALRYLRELLTLVALSDDAREGIKAFFEKRAPNWTGR